MNTRFAPSPTGQLHLGHVTAMIYVWGLAAAQKATVHVRIEDHDRQRCRPRFVDELRDDLHWLGFVPTNGGRWSQQSQHDKRFAEALALLREQGLVYACCCSRKDAVRAPGASEGRYSGRCRDLDLTESQGTALRVRLPDDVVRFYDPRHGWQSQQPATQCGDPVIRDRLGQWTYQFAVTVDDLHDDIDWVIRGDDLLDSTGRQILLARLLGRKTPLHFFHHPLIFNPDGTKLSKRDDAAPIGALRQAGLSAAEIIGQAAFRCGLATYPTAVAANELRQFFARYTREELFARAFSFGGLSARDHDRRCETC